MRFLYLPGAGSRILVNFRRRMPCGEEHRKAVCGETARTVTLPLFLTQGTCAQPLFLQGFSVEMKLRKVSVRAWKPPHQHSMEKLAEGSHGAALRCGSTRDTERLQGRPDHSLGGNALLIGSHRLIRGAFATGSRSGRRVSESFRFFRDECLRSRYPLLF